MTTAFSEPELLLSVPPRSHRRPARRGTPEAALREIPDGSRVVIPPLSGTPLGLLAELDRMRDGWSDLELASGLLLEPIAPLDHPGDPFRFITYQTSGAYRPSEAAGVLDHIPTFYVQVSELFEPGSALPADAVLVQVSSPHELGMYSLGNSASGILNAIRTAPLVIAQVNPRVPRIVKELPPGATVTSPPYFADIVVTEYGAAQLRGRTLGQRAAALWAISHPDFRSELGS